MSVRHFDQVEVGEALPALTKEITSVRQMMYGAATWDFVRFHYDADLASERGFPAPFADGQMMGAFMAQLVMDWAGPEAFLASLSFRNRVMVFPDDTLTCLGKVTNKSLEDGKSSVECELWIENRKKETVAEGKATVSLTVSS